MSAELFLCACQEDITEPYQFKVTNINVYSLEEAVYHCYHYWKQSYDEFTSASFLRWVRETLGLPYIAGKISVIDQIDNAKEKLLAFLKLFDYVDEAQITALKAKFSEWEQSLLWERLKERADFAYRNGMPSKAVYYYKKALESEENPQLLNNMGVGLMSLSLFEEAQTYLDRALAMSPKDVQILLNSAEAAIFNRSFEKALRNLAAAEELDRENCAFTSNILALYGELNLEAGNVRYSIDYFERAINIKPDARNIFSLTDVYVKLRQYDKAMETLKRTINHDKAYLIKLASLYHEANNIPAAIKTIEKAIIEYNNDPLLWTKLAQYHRLDYDLQRAESAILKALALEKHGSETLLEYARIKKAMGSTKEYRMILHSILGRLKAKYREGVGGY